MDTNGLLTKAGEKLKETIKDFVDDKKQLVELTRERGNLLALELLETKPKQKDKIEKLNKTIINLKLIIEDTPAIIDGLKKAKLKLMSQKEKEEKEEAKNSQTKLEISLNSSSKKLVKLLKDVQIENSQLRTFWSEWDKLNLISGEGLTNKKCIRSSQDMLDLVVKTMLSEWAGTSNGEVRKFYSKNNYMDTRLIF